MNDKPSPIARSEHLPSFIYHSSDKRTAVDSAERDLAGLANSSTPTALPPSTRISFDDRTANRRFLFRCGTFGASPVLPQVYKRAKSSSGSRGSSTWQLRDRWRVSRRLSLCVLRSTVRRLPPTAEAT